MRVFRPFGVLVITVFAMACSYEASRKGASVTSPDPVASTSSATGNATSGAMASTPLSATVQFGLENVGSSNPPDHPSFHANDTIVPGTVVIAKGGTVTFNAVSIHQPAIYQPGKEPEDVDTANTIAMPAGCPALPPFRIDDPVGRIAINGSNPVGCGPRTFTHTFDTPGRYLVICEVLPHFQIKMYGWVIVREQ